MIGIFLVNEGEIDCEAFFRVSAERSQRTDPIGKIALAERMMTMKQVMHVLAEQEEKQNRFGETAIQLEYLTREDLWRLIYLQSEQRPEFLSCAIELGILTRARADACGARYRASIGTKGQSTPKRADAD